MTEWPSPPAYVSAVLAGGPGFVAVGYESTGAYLCERPSVDGIVWTSSDGEDWIESRPQDLAGLSLRRLVNAGGTLYAFGSVGHVDCASEYVFATARSFDGTNWERLRLQPDLPDDFWISAVGSTGGALIVLTEDTTWTMARVGNAAGTSRFRTPGSRTSRRSEKRPLLSKASRRHPSTSRQMQASRGAMRT